jgi:branched-chain amino acid transport system substrate-binding protein
MLRKSVMVGLMVGLFVLLAAVSQPSAQPIKIAALGPMKVTPGANQWRAAELAAEEINETGGVLIGGVKRPIRIIKTDTSEEVSATDAVAAIEKVITVDKVDFLVGTHRTESTLAMQDVAMKNRKILIVTGAASPIVCERVGTDYDKYKYTFRTWINSAFMGKAMFMGLDDLAKRVRKELGIEKPKLAVFSEKLVWADPVVKAAEAMAPKMGLELVGVWRPSAAATDVTPELKAIQTSGAHIIYTATSGTMGVVMCKQWGELQVPAAMIGGHSHACVKGFWKATGGYGNYASTFTGIGPAKITPKTLPFWNKFVKRFDEFPGYESSTYDAVYLLKEAIEKSGTLDSDAIVTQLEKMEYVGAYYPKITFFPKGEKFAHDLRFGPGLATGVINQWIDGDVKVIWPYGWEGITYEGSKPYTYPPWFVKHWKK